MSRPGMTHSTGTLIRVVSKWGKMSTSLTPDLPNTRNGTQPLTVKTGVRVFKGGIKRGEGFDRTLLSVIRQTEFISEDQPHLSLERFLYVDPTRVVYPRPKLLVTGGNQPLTPVLNALPVYEPKGNGKYDSDHRGSVRLTVKSESSSWT